jgi:pilus assembly protein Flp/PilA
MPHSLRRFLQDESAATAIEYGLIATLISMALFVGFGSFADSLGGLWDVNSGKITDAFRQGAE